MLFATSTYIDGGLEAGADVDGVLGAFLGIHGDGDDALVLGLILDDPFEASRLELEDRGT